MTERTAPAGDTPRRIEIASVDALWTWLESNHRQSESVWLVTFKKHTGTRYVSTGAVLDALIAYGWVDGRRMKLDADRTMQLISPRRTQTWAQSYKDRAARLIDAKRMHAEGLAAIARSKQLGLWDDMADVDALMVPDDLASALAQLPAAERFFLETAPSYRRNVLRWIKIAKRTETRSRRIAQVVETSRRAERIPQM
ncbi:MAG: YdeI/OmpD-associated family protein [Pseudomonadota bacterium]